MIYNDTRDALFNELYQIAVDDPKVIVLSADTGARKFKDFQENIPKQFYNVGISEANMMSVAAGLALNGRHVFVFGISNFVTLRCFEQVKLDICSMNLPVTILGMGTGYSYSSDGTTHHIIDDISIMRALSGITIWNPSDYAMSAKLVHMAYELNSPSYIRFDKGPFRHLYDSFSKGFEDGMIELTPGMDATIISTGIMVSKALEISLELSKKKLDVGVIDLYRLKPVNKELLRKLVSKRVITLEEHSVIGGLGSIVAEALSDVKVYGIPDIYHFEAGSREYLQKLDGVDNETIINGILGGISDEG
jgi:transketolase